MAELDPEQEPPPESDASDEIASASERERKRLQLTPEQRRFMGAAKSKHSPPPPEQKKTTAPPKSKSSAPVAQPSEGNAPHRRRRWKPSTALEMQNVVLLLGALVLMAGIFYVGKKYEYWRYLIASRRDAKLAAQMTNEFRGASAEELVEHAIMSERLGKWEDAVNRLIAAKYKNMALGGVLFRAGKLSYDHGSFDSADRLFESAIGFGENVDAANYFRGMIASARSDFPAAERFFEAASNAAPFNADYCYSLGETLRKDHRPKDAIARYDQAARRATDEEQVVCRFKQRMAELEAGDIAAVRTELNNKQNLGNLSVDWLMTAAALAISEGDTSHAVQLVDQAREADQSRLFALFAACASDRFFAVACQNNDELTRACSIQRSNGFAPLQPPTAKPDHP